MSLLEVEELQVRFGGARGTVHAVDGVSFHVDKGETLAVVGESGCGKSAMAMAILGLTARIGRQTGKVSLDGVRLDQLSDKALRSVRGRDVGVIFQEPASSLNPVLSIGLQLREVLDAHTTLSAGQKRDRVVELLARTGIPDPAGTADRYPHQISGGMRQRVMIAIALACGPKLIIADEPTTALDVTIQAQILELLRDIQRKEGTAIMLITHDLGVVAENADRMLVMYAGRKVEEGAVARVLASPAHPYTQGLMRAVPVLGKLDTERHRLPDIPGTVPLLTRSHPGCAFIERCTSRREVCSDHRPPAQALTPDHLIVCHNSGEVLHVD